MAEIDRLRAECDQALKVKRMVACYWASRELHRKVESDLNLARYRVNKALAEWWAQGCREVEVRPLLAGVKWVACPRCCASPYKTFEGACVVCGEPSK